MVVVVRKSRWLVGVAMVGGVVQSDRGCQGVGVVGLVILVKGLG